MWPSFLGLRLQHFGLWTWHCLISNQDWANCVQPVISTSHVVYCRFKHCIRPRVVVLIHSHCCEVSGNTAAEVHGAMWFMQVQGHNHMATWTPIGYQVHIVLNIVGWPHCWAQASSGLVKQFASMWGSRLIGLLYLNCVGVWQHPVVSNQLIPDC